MIPAPIRETEISHQCRCVLVHQETGHRDRCPASVYDPDSPVCPDCEDRHRNDPTAAAYVDGFRWEIAQ